MTETKPATKIEEIIQSSSKQVKRILLEEAAKLTDFPQMLIGIPNRRYQDASSRGIAVLKPGILVYEAKKFWQENHYVIMLPDGLYRFHTSRFLETRNGRSTNLLAAFPAWESKEEKQTDYLVHGIEAFRLMRERL